MKALGAEQLRFLVQKIIDPGLPVNPDLLKNMNGEAKVGDDLMALLEGKVEALDMSGNQIAAKDAVRAVCAAMRQHDGSVVFEVTVYHRKYRRLYLADGEAASALCDREVSPHPDTAVRQSIEFHPVLHSAWSEGAAEGPFELWPFRGRYFGVAKWHAVRKRSAWIIDRIECTVPAVVWHAWMAWTEAWGNLGRPRCEHTKAVEEATLDQLRLKAKRLRAQTKMSTEKN